jgi:uncharacterized protein YyaL (SSP411 family)
MPNRLAQEISPYLLQHAGNPVDWYAWGAEALELARAEQKPIFLSIGYSSCHWCHVMAHESFEDPQIARLLREGFISIKVDREERPDLDKIYMEAVQAMTGQGGWPLSVFLTPALEPFFGGTYWPARSRAGMPGFDQIIRAVADAWQNRREEVLAQAGRLTHFLRENRYPGGDGEPADLDDGPLSDAEMALAGSFDHAAGGFGHAPKFPQPIALELLLRRWQRLGGEDLLRMVTTTLEAMALGGIYDHLGGGFHRYSVDARWLVPHFEKMLYDNALLAGCYVAAWQATGQPAYAQTARETLDYVLRDLTEKMGTGSEPMCENSGKTMSSEVPVPILSQGGFYSSEDADSEGAEGMFYLWTPAQVTAVLGADAARVFCRVYDVSELGNFEGRNILHLSRPIEVDAEMLGREAGQLVSELADSRRKLLAARAGRVRPGRDDKVLVSWNGLVLDALARAGAALGEPRYTEAAVRSAVFLLRNLRQGDGRLWHCWRSGRAKGTAFLDDYASLANALVTLYETCAEKRWLDVAVELADQVIARFGDADHGGFFYTPADHEPLIVRKKDALDSSTPSGNGLAAMLLLRLGRLCQRPDYVAAAEETLRAHLDLMRQMPTGTGQLLLALEEYLRAKPQAA